MPSSDIPLSGLPLCSSEAKQQELNRWFGLKNIAFYRTNSIRETIKTSSPVRRAFTATFCSGFSDIIDAEICPSARSKETIDSYFTNWPITTLRCLANALNFKQWVVCSPYFSRFSCFSLPRFPRAGFRDVFPRLDELEKKSRDCSQSSDIRKSVHTTKKCISCIMGLLVVVWGNCTTLLVSGFVPPKPPKCYSALGMQSGKIPDAAISASSNWNAAHRAANARLHFQSGHGRTGAWSAKHNNAHQFLQVHFGNYVKITVIATQGRQDANQWVKSFTLSYSYDGVFFYIYKKNKVIFFFWGGEFIFNSCPCYIFHSQILKWILGFGILRNKQHQTLLLFKTNKVNGRLTSFCQLVQKLKPLTPIVSSSWRQAISTGFGQLVQNLKQITTIISTLKSSIKRRGVY